MRKAFSIITTAPSTIIPVPTARPPRDMRLAESPVRSMSRNAMSIERGTAETATSADRTSPRKRNRTTMTSTPASSSARSAGRALCCLRGEQVLEVFRGSGGRGGAADRSSAASTFIGRGSAPERRYPLTSQGSRLGAPAWSRWHVGTTSARGKPVLVEAFGALPTSADVWRVDQNFAVTRARTLSSAWRSRAPTRRWISSRCRYRTSRTRFLTTGTLYRVSTLHALFG